MVVEDVVLIAVAPLLVGWILWLLFKRHQLQAQLRLKRAKTLDRLIEKFGTSQEMVDFLKSESGRKLLEDPVPSASSSPARVRRFLLGGVMLVALGSAFFLNALRYRGMTDINFVNEAIGLNNWGTVFVSVGAALLIMAVASYSMARR